MTTQPQLAGPAANYADVFDLTLSPYGAAFRFGVSGPVTPQGQQSVELNSRVYMSLEHLKALAFVCTREVLKHEHKMGVVIPIPDAVLAQLLYPPPDKLTKEQMQEYLAQMQPLATDQWRQFWAAKAQAVGNGAVQAPVPAKG